MRHVIPLPQRQMQGEQLVQQGYQSCLGAFFGAFIKMNTYGHMLCPAAAPNTGLIRPYFSGGTAKVCQAQDEAFAYSW